MATRESMARNIQDAVRKKTVNTCRPFSEAVICFSISIASIKAEAPAVVARKRGYVPKIISRYLLSGMRWIVPINDKLMNIVAPEII